jgi:hypothetical protein
VLLAALLTMSLGAAPRVASAQTDEQRSGARAAAQAGLDAFDAQKWKEALDYFTRAENMLHAPVHLYYMGYSRMKLGQLVGAREAFLKLKNEHMPSTAPKAFRTAQADAAKELDVIEPRIPTLKLVVAPQSPKGLVLSIDGKDTPADTVGIPTPIDPGAHALKARAEGMESDTVQVNIKEGARDSVTLVLKPTAAGLAASALPGATSSASGGGSGPGLGIPSVGAGAPSAGAGAGAGGPPGTSADTGPGGGGSGNPASGSGADAASGAGSGSKLRLPAYLSLGVSGVALLGGTVFALQSASARKDAEALCPNGKCPESRRNDVESKNSEADDQGRLAVVGMTVAGAAAAAGVTLLFLSGSSSQAKSNVRVVPVAGLSSAGVAGTFLARRARR